MDNYEVITKVGSGACGAVYLVRDIKNSRQYALKKVQLDAQKRTRTREALLREARILAQLKHPHIVAYHDSFFADADDLSFMHIVQDYCDGGTLDDKIISMRKTQNYFKEHTIMEWFIQIAMAVQYIHSHKILHRDLKAQNVFMTKSDGVKLGDFGIAKVLDNTLDAAVTCVGTPCYLSPELCQDIPYSSKSDIWALGCLLFELCALKPAFDGNNLISLFYKITKAEYASLPDQFSEEIKRLIAAILIKEADVRPSASAILNMTTVRNYLETFIQDREYLLKQKIITLRAKTGVSSGHNSPTFNKSAKSRREDDLSATVRKSTPVIHSKLMSSLPPLRRSLQPTNSNCPADSAHHGDSAHLANSAHLDTHHDVNSQMPTQTSLLNINNSSGQEDKALVSPNYSDDFDSTGASSDSASNVSEEAEIPEEICADVEETTPSKQSNNIQEQVSDTRGAASETEIDVNNGTVSYYEDDFEDDSEAEELDNIITKAKEAHTLPAQDEYFIDETHSQHSQSQSLKQYLTSLGTDFENLSTKE